MNPSPILGAGVDRRLFVAAGAAGAAGLVSACSIGGSQEFPSRPIMIISPARPGGGTDQIARMLQHSFDVENLVDVPVEVVNRGGAGGAIGLTELVSRHRGDPYAIMAVAGGLVGAAISQNSPFSLLDTVPLARLLVEHLIIAVPADSRFRDIDSFLATFRSRPETITWCGGSAGGTDHTLVGMIAEALGVPPQQLSYVAYAGGGAASAALLGGQVTAGINGFSEWGGLAESGHVRILACASAERFGDRSIPTLREAGLDVVYQNWRGAFAPPGLEPDHLAWWFDRIERARRSRSWAEMIDRFGLEDGYVPGPEFERQIAQQMTRTEEVLANLGIGGQSGGVSTMGPYTFAGIVGGAGAIAVGAAVVEKLRAAPPSDAAQAPAAHAIHDEPEPTWTRFAAGAAAMLAYAFALEYLGFLIATPLLILGISWLMRATSLVRNGLAGIAVTVVVWLLFTRLLYIDLP